MFIQTEATPNPATLKFLPGGQVVMGKGTADFSAPERAAKSPLAQRLFAVDGVAGVFLGPDFITVSKTDAQTWDQLKPQVLMALMAHFNSGDPVVEAGAEDEVAPDDDAIVTRIKDLLDTRVRPTVAQDGGDIVFHSFTDGVVYLHMQGSCAGCPSSTATLKNGVENLLRYYVPEVQRVEAVPA